MAADMFLMIEDIDGESVGDGHEKEIDISDYNFGMSQSISSKGGGKGGGKASVRHLSITKSLDKATPLMMRALMSGAHIDTMKLTMRKSGGTPVEHFKMLMHGCALGGYTTMPGASNDRFQESWTIYFTTFQIDYQPQDSTSGAAKGAVKEFGWNVTTNKAL